jgi:hypothetical protein
MNSKWVTVILGVALILAPFVTGYNNSSTATWISVIFGAAVVVLGYLKKHTATAVVGVLIFVAPSVLEFNGVPNALWSCLLLGGVVALLEWYRAIVQYERMGPGSVPRNHLHEY